MKAWVITNKEAGNLLLWPHSAGYFQVIDGEGYQPLIHHAGYTLIQQRFTLAFNRLTAQVNIVPATIKDALLGTERNDYAELRIANQLPHTDNSTTFSDDIEIWTYGAYLFVSNRIKEELGQIDATAFTFSKGFGRFAG